MCVCVWERWGVRVDKSSSRLHHKFLKFSGAKAYFGSILIYKLQFLFCQNLQHVRGAATHQPFQVFCHLRQYKGILNTILLKLLRFLLLAIVTNVYVKWM